MSYVIQAIVAKAGVMRAQVAHVRTVRIGQDLEMAPLTSDLREQLGIPFCPLTDDDAEVPSLPESIGALCNSLSENGSLAYIEAEIFGGVGMQASAVFRDGLLAASPVVSDRAINQALRALGVRAGEHMDEFAAVDLGRFRSTDEWVA